MRRFAGTLLAAALAGSLPVGCGGPQGAGLPTDPVELFSAGDYRAARLAAKARGGTNPTDRAVIALSFLAENADEEARSSAVTALREGASEAEAIAASEEMLDLFAATPKLVDEERSLLVLESAIGATGPGPAGSPPRIEDAADGSRTELAISLLERLRFCLGGASEFSTGRVLAIWNGCFGLLRGEMKGSSEYRSWQLYLNVAGLAVIVSEAAPVSDLERALLSSTVAAVEASPLLAPAVRCDLSSPVDELRAALFRAPELNARFERAIEKALGCSRGRYAPEPPR